MGEQNVPLVKCDLLMRCPWLGKGEELESGETESQMNVSLSRLCPSDSSSFPTIAYDSIYLYY